MTSVLYDHPGPRARRRYLIYSLFGTAVVVAVLFLAYVQLDSRGQWDGERWQVFWDPPLGQSASDVWRSLLVTGLGATLQAAAVAAVLALSAGLILAIARTSHAFAVRLPHAAVILVLTP